MRNLPCVTCSFFASKSSLTETKTTLGALYSGNNALQPEVGLSEADLVMVGTELRLEVSRVKNHKEV